MKAWHFSNGYLGYGDGRKVEAGVTYEATGDIGLCINGMHGSISPLDALSFGKGCIVSRVEITGGVVRGDDKVVGERRKVLWCADATEVLRKFARMCALDVIGKWGAPAVVVRYLKTGDESIRVEARHAADAAADADAADAAYAAYAAAAYAADAAYAAAAYAAAAYAADAYAADAAAAAYAARKKARESQRARLGRMLAKLKPSESKLPGSTENFTLAEFACKDGSPVPDDMRDDALALMANLEVLRRELGDKPIRIVSGYRSPEYNTKIGGSKGSKHMLAQAADIRVSGVQPKKVADTIERLIRAGDMQEGGLGRYAGFTHYDIRGKRARWGKN